MPGTEGKKPSPEEIALVRARAKEMFVNGGLENYSQVDINKLQQDEVVELFWLHTYWLSGDQVDETVDMIEKTFRWRKEFGVNEIRRESLSQKIMETGAMSVREETDKAGYKILVMRVRKYVKNKDDVEDMKKCMVSFLEDLRKENISQEITLVFDCNGAGLKNVDLDVIKFLISLFQNYYPHMLGKILIYDLPWILNPVFVIIKVRVPLLSSPFL